jgi:SAM-dependent methyltransferase
VTEWYREAFNRQYLDLYAHRGEEEAALTVEFLVSRLGLQKQDLILDAPCGGGRHSREFASRGFRICGADLSADLLHFAQSAPVPSNLHFTRADIRALPFADCTFRATLNLFSSFGYFFEETENISAMRELSRVTAAGGHIVIDFMNEPQVRANLKTLSQRTTFEGRPVTETRWITAPPARIEKRVNLELPNGSAHEFFESVRLYTPGELTGMMQHCGMGEFSIYGDYSGADYTAQSPRAIITGRKL